MKAYSLNELELSELSELTSAPSSSITLTWEVQSITRAQEAINRLYRRVHDNIELREWQIELLAKVNKYKLSYCLIDWFELSDMMEELELLISEAESYGIYDWDANDIVDLKQKIEDAQHKAARKHTTLRNEYLSSIL